jgi:hypothetical protein
MVVAPSATVHDDHCAPFSVHLPQGGWWPAATGVAQARMREMNS